MTLMQKLAENKSTTLSGAGAIVISLVLAAIPDDIRTGCLDAVQSSDSPVVIGLLLFVGIAGTVIGPSLARKST